ncbi:DUF397 domain-containing protein [Streptomyces scopuliridis]|uniref:DUF397 domain-containing protein n=1 Tax=Streptomyces scopuliridis TaxID=452529 RepID=UPI0036C0AC93
MPGDRPRAGTSATPDRESPLIQELRWHKSSYSGQNGGDCIECAVAPEAQVLVRDSKDVKGPRLAFTSQAWAEFVTASVTDSFGPVGR